MAFADFANLLKTSIGLDAASIGASAVERAVLERVSACGVAGPSAYWQRVCASPAELQELIEAVIVPETWFFRDRGAFATAVRLAPDRPWAHAPDGVRRILSFPSSTGEEPYSIAMALFDAGILADRFSVDGADISAQAIALARAGLYGRNSFRGRDLEFRSRYFEPVGNRYQLADKVRGQVQFRQANLLARDVAPQPIRYDVIFCRNLLIYFDRPTQQLALQALERLLTPEGVVVVAPCETSVLLSGGFSPLQAPFAFAFHPGAPSAGEAKSGRRKAHSVRPAQIRVAPRPSRLPGARSGAPASAPAVLTTGSAGAAAAGLKLQEARELANRGCFADAIERCQQHLVRSGPSAEVFHLMGLVHDASGNAAGAVSCYRKALYLDPNHREVLAHLTLLLEKAGERSQAQLLRKRTHRLKQGSATQNATSL